jgi:high-affinity Fe2+/Pb2+ permease
MIQDNELVNLLSGLAAILVLVFIAKKVEWGKLSFFYAAFGAMLCAYTSTILEGFFWGRFFNLVEHFSLAVAGILFAIGCWHLSHNGKMDKNGG